MPSRLLAPVVAAVQLLRIPFGPPAMGRPSASSALQVPTELALPGSVIPAEEALKPPIVEPLVAPDAFGASASEPSVDASGDSNGAGKVRRLISRTVASWSGGGSGAIGEFRSLADSISRASPIEGFQSYVYENALSAARYWASRDGHPTTELRVTGATLRPDMFGEEWTFHFVSPSAAGWPRPRGYAVTVRRTMVAETMIDVVKEEVERPRAWIRGVRAETFPGLVRLSPMEAIGRTGADARTLEIQARGSRARRSAAVRYVVRGEQGRVVMRIDATTADVSR